MSEDLTDTGNEVTLISGLSEFIYKYYGMREVSICHWYLCYYTFFKCSYHFSVTQHINAVLVIEGISQILLG